MNGSLIYLFLFFLIFCTCKEKYKEVRFVLSEDNFKKYSIYKDYSDTTVLVIDKYEVTNEEFVKFCKREHLLLPASNSNK